MTHHGLDPGSGSKFVSIRDVLGLRELTFVV